MLERKFSSSLWTNSNRRLTCSKARNWKISLMGFLFTGELVRSKCYEERFPRCHFWKYPQIKSVRAIYFFIWNLLDELDKCFVVSLILDCFEVKHFAFKNFILWNRDTLLLKLGRNVVDFLFVLLWTSYDWILIGLIF